LADVIALLPERPVLLSPLTVLVTTPCTLQYTRQGRKAGYSTHHIWTKHAYRMAIHIPKASEVVRMGYNWSPGLC